LNNSDTTFYSHAEEGVEESLIPIIKYLTNIADHATALMCWNEKKMRDEVKLLENLGSRFVFEGEKDKREGWSPCLRSWRERRMTYTTLSTPGM